jgi:23S rRNA (uracil1939-C5)-methyltransferase
MGESFQVRPRQLVAGGAAIGTDPDGRVVLVEGALPGELVAVEPLRSSTRMVVASVTHVVEPAASRVAPVCPAVAKGCGGCDLPYADPTALPGFKVEIVRDALRHLGGRRTEAVFVGDALASWGYRTTVRAIVDDRGVAGFRRSKSHTPVAPGRCGVAHPLVDEVLTTGRFPGAAQVTIRAGLVDGSRLVVVEPTEGSSPEAVLSDVVVPSDVVVVGSDGVVRGTDGERGVIRERVGGRDWRISALSFFQTRPDGAESLVATVAAAVERLCGHGADRRGRLIDAYCGVGLLAGSLRTAGWEGPIAGIERSPDACDDAAVNLRHDDVEIVAGDVAATTLGSASVVVADPSRSGLGREAVDRLAATGAEGIVLVSCDAASLGRDTALLSAAGFDHQDSTLVDMFPHTHHVEVVSSFMR